MTEALVVLVTVPSRQAAETLAAALVGESLAACVNLVGPITSFYRWQDEVHRDDEHLLVIKTTRPGYAALEARVLALHPYETPEVLALPVQQGAAAYLAWLTGAVS